MKRKYTIAIDFDGVVHRYSRGWHDGTAYDEPMDGAFDMICRIRSRGYNVVIFSARPVEQIGKWFLKWWPTIPPYGDIPEITNTKPIAVAYIDDRAIRHTDWEKTWEDLRVHVFTK
jgi:hypothetical protein